MKLLGQISVVLFISLILFEVIIITISRWFKIPSWVITFLSYLSN